MTAAVDIAGQRFGKLFCESLAPSRKGRRAWLCLCDCGKTCVVMTGKLRGGKTKSCGCLRVSLGRAFRKTPGQSGQSALYNRYRQDAKVRGLEFDVARSVFNVLVESNCVYCGAEPSRTIKHSSSVNFTEDGKRNSEFRYNGLDRVDSSRGYVEGNLVSCCFICNRAKSNLPIDVFLTWVKAVYTHRKFGSSVDG